ncbi:MAG: phosphoadenylyl-sulfate reductase [Ilumatobacteraceae bacterium]
MTLLQTPADVEQLHPTEVLRWAFETYGVANVAVTSSFEDAVLVHLAVSVDPAADIVLLDTQYLFAETWWLVEQMQNRFGVNVRVVSPQPDVQRDNLWQTDVEACCAVRKVEPLARALGGKAAWVTGVRRVDGPTRANTPVASYDINRNLVKINPLAAWTDADMALYAEINDLPANPLSARGYPSIGCWPCTRPVAEGEDRRGGRWSGSAKTECGLHV